MTTPTASTLTDAWRLSVGMLTALPVRPPGRVDRGVARGAILLAPLAVLPLGATVTLICWAGPLLDLPTLAVGLLAVAVVVLGNRAFHVDGLSDTVDGLTASHDRERSLAVMRSGTSGPAGGVAVALVLGLQAVGFAALASTGQLTEQPWPAVAAGLAVCASRCALALTCASGVPGARSEQDQGSRQASRQGSSLGGTYVGTVPRTAAAASWLVAAAVLAVVVGAVDGSAWWRAPVACAVAIVVLSWLVRRTVRRLGGVTGDVFGAAVELALAALLVVLA